MAAKILDGKALAQFLSERLEERLTAKSLSPTLVIYRIGNDPASAVYVRNKVRAAEKVGIYTIVREYDEDAMPYAVKHQIAEDAQNPNRHGIMIQLPLPQGWRERELIELIPPEKDVDGLTYTNMGRVHDHTAFHNPCTAQGIITLLHSHGIDLAGKHVVVVGRSEIVGKPFALLALTQNATVTICHSHTQGLAAMTKQADILVVAVGKPGLITSDMVKPGAVVVDVGINRLENGKLCGDVDFNGVSEVAEWISPVPGGVGPMTVAILMQNTYNATRYI